MGLVPQGRRVFPTLSVEENLLVAERNAERHGWNLDRVYALFPRLQERRNQRAKTLSGGEQQMLAIGRGADDQSGLPDHGRAVRRAGAHHHPGRVGGDRQAQGRRPLDPAGRAERHLALKLVDYVHVMSKGQVVYSAQPEELRANEQIKSSYLGI